MKRLLLGLLALIAGVTYAASSWNPVIFSFDANVVGEIIDDLAKKRDREVLELQAIDPNLRADFISSFQKGFDAAVNGFSFPTLFLETEYLAIKGQPAPPPDDDPRGRNPHYDLRPAEAIFWKVFNVSFTTSPVMAGSQYILTPYGLAPLSRNHPPPHSLRIRIQLGT